MNELTLLVLAGVAVVAAIVSAPHAVLPTLAIIAIFGVVAWFLVYQKDALAMLTSDKGTCDLRDSTCPVSNCSIQSIDNPFANPILQDFGTDRLYGTDCSLDRAKALMKAREGFGFVRFADEGRFHKVPGYDVSNYRMWLYDIPSNCKHDQRACNPRPTILDAMRRGETTGSFADYI